MPLKRYHLFLFLSSLFIIISACGRPARPPEPENLVWPMPPEQPRIKYLQSIYSEDDIGRVYSFKEKLFGKGYIDRMMRPYGVFARGERIVVADIVMKRVLVYDRGKRRLVIIGQEGAVKLPAAVVLDKKGNFYVADAEGQRIVLYDQQGTYKTAFLLNGSKTVSLALNEKLGRLYVVDTIGNKVIVLNIEDGKRLFDFGGSGILNGQFNMPLDIAIDNDGIVYVLDVRNFRVQIFKADGTFIRTFGEVGDGPGFFANPKGIAVDSYGHIYITDAAFSNVQIFDQKGRVLLFIGGLGPRPGQFHLPAGISIDEQNRIYVADQLNRRVQVFQYLGEQ